MRILPLLALLLLFSASHADGPAVEGPHEFKSKYLSVYQLNKSTQTWFTTVLEKASVRKLGDRWFIIGSAVNVGGDSGFRKGTVVWLPLADALQLEEFDSLERNK